MRSGCVGRKAPSGARRVSGCLYAVRRSAYRHRARAHQRLVIALHLREQGMRTVLEPAAVCFEETLAQAGQELAMRVRVAVRTIYALLAERRLLNPVRYGLFAWQLWSHKVFALRLAALLDRRAGNKSRVGGKTPIPCPLLAADSADAAASRVFSCRQSVRGS